jgi:hypothetical protein
VVAEKGRDRDLEKRRDVFQRMKAEEFLKDKGKRIRDKSWSWRGEMP